MLGDSMTDQLGDKFDYILPVLTKKYPQTDFLLFNYGIGATDVVSGLNRLTVKTTRHEKELIPLLTLKPDIIILESFAYNHWTGSEKDLDQYRNTLQAIIDKIREEKIDLIGLRTIAPNSNVITDGIPNIQLTKEEKKEKSALIKKYLELFEQIVKKNNLPLVDTYTKSLDITGNGKLLYISKTDHLHPSADGLKLISEGILKDLEKVIVASASSIY
jgi:lysophospholipase L1-like esterase